MAPQPVLGARSHTKEAIGGFHGLEGGTAGGRPLKGHGDNQPKYIARIRAACTPQVRTAQRITASSKTREFAESGQRQGRDFHIAAGAGRGSLDWALLPRPTQKLRIAR